jgi:surface carbohydrate biosynthesis protein
MAVILTLKPNASFPLIFMSPLPLLIIPFEILVREIDGSILLAHEYISRGGSCLIGQKTTLLPFSFLLPGSIWFLKSIVPGEIFVQERILKSKGLIFSYDVEGLVPSVGEIGVRQRMNEASISRTKAHFCWNIDEFHRYASIFPDYAYKFEASGIPIQYAWSIAKSSQTQKSKSILIISSFPLICPLNTQYSRQQSRSCSGNLEDQQSQFENEISMQSDGFKNMHNLVSHLTELGYSVTIRMHPAELSNIWFDFESSPLVSFVSSSKPVAESIFSSSVVFCMNSTVSVQCKAMSIPCIQYLPDDFINQYSAVLSQVAIDHSTVVNSLNKVEPLLKDLSSPCISSNPINPSSIIIDRIISCSQHLSVSPISSFLSLRLFIYIRRAYVFVLFILSRIPLISDLLGPRFVGPMYYRVFSAKCPFNLSSSLDSGFSRMSIDKYKFHISCLDRNLVLLSPRK